MKRQSEQKDDGTMQREVERIQQYAGEYDVVPIKKEIFADVITPISLLRRLAETQAFLSAGERRRGREMGTLFFSRVRSGHAGDMFEKTGDYRDRK